MKSLVATLCTVVVVVVVTAAVALPAAAAPGGYRYQTVRYPGSANTALYAVNDLRQVVGAEKDLAGKHHAIFDDGTHLALLDLGALGSGVVESWAFSINTPGDIAGTVVDAAGRAHGYLRHVDGSVETLDFPGANDTQGYGVNDHGEVIGQYTDAGGAVHAYRRVDGRYSTIDLPGGVQTVPLSVNNAGQIAGEFIRTDGTVGYGYLQAADGSFTLYSAAGAPAESTFFISVNNLGEVLGAYVDSVGAQVNFLRRKGRHLPVDLPAAFGAQYVSAQTVNDGDDVVGYYVDADGVAQGVTAFARDTRRAK